MPKITVTIDKLGNATVEVDGVKGSNCTEMTKRLIAALGGARSEEPTREMFESEIEVDQEVHRG